MLPWKIAVGLTVAGAGVLGLVLAEGFQYLRPHASYIAAVYGLDVAIYFGGAAAAFGITAGALARSMGLVDVGRKVDVIDRSIRRGEGSPELGRILREEEEGTYTE